MKYVRTLIMAAALGGAPAYAQEPKQAPAEVTPNEARSWIQLFDKVVDTVVTHRDDCSKMADGVSLVAETHKDTIAMARDAKAKGKKLPQSAQQHMLDSMRRMVAALDKCGRDEKVGAAFKRLDLGSR